MKISKDYFGYLAKNYPVMCLSDEFYFFPRAKEAARFLNHLDSLDEEKIKQDVAYVKKLKSSLEKLDSEDMGLEAQIDLRLLSQSMDTFLREFGQIKIWQVDPSLYLKIALLGIDQLLKKSFSLRADIDDCLRDRISQTPRLLNEAKNNLKKIPRAYLDVSIEVVEASINYFKATAFSPKVHSLVKMTLKSLEDFKRFLKKRPSSAVFMRDRRIIESILKDSFSYNRTLEEIFEIASLEYARTLKELERIAKKVDSKKSWQEILSSYKMDIKKPDEFLRLYSCEIRRLKDFFTKNDVFNIKKTQDIKVRFTPQFMEPIRASASYNSPVTNDMKEPAYFYISGDVRENRDLHNEYIFVSAHETYPGHHLLDSIRRKMTNPIRQQIESPLFYEGWASYAESLISHLGYIKDPLHKMLGLKRQAWRTVRAMLDVGIRINSLKFEDAENLLKGLGYAPKIARFMFRHYALSPGYQLCYTIGKFEIDKLKEKFSSRLGLRGFHDFLLQGGQIPFDLIEQRMEKELCKDHS
ncbi:DUF885 domain-containing protein [Candidatus Omnitrophota bacterium]